MTNDQEVRLQCLTLASAKANSQDQVVDLARDYYDFVTETKDEKSDAR